MDIDLQIKYSRALQEVQRERNLLRAENEQLKKQLSNKDNKIQVLEKQRNNYRHKRNEYRKQLKPIKKQLAESEQEVDILEKDYEFVAKKYKLLKKMCDITFEQINQDKIEFAVEQLILFKNDIENKMKTRYVFSLEDVWESLEILIKQLKEGK